MKNKIILYKILLILVCFGLPMLIPQVHGKIILSLILVWLFCSPNFNLLKNALFIGVCASVCMALIAIFYSTNLTYAFKYIETYAALIVLPSILFSSKDILFDKVVTIGLKAFVIGVISLNILSLFFISYNLWDPKNLQTNLIAANNIIVAIHPAFLSMYIALCVFFLVDQYFPLKKLSRVKLGWVTFSLVVLLVFLVWLNSRAGIFAFSLAALFFIGCKWSGKPRLVGFVGLTIFLLLIGLLPFSKHRFLSTPKMVLTGETTGFENDPSVYPLLNRIQILKCDIELLKWPEILYGYGTGDFRDELQTCFATNGYERPLAENMDSHSEYFAQLHRHGIIGLALFLALLIVPFRHALKYKSPLLGTFVILFGITALFENVFSAQKGVTFFALFCPLLWFYAKQQYETKVMADSSPPPILH